MDKLEVLNHVLDVMNEDAVSTVSSTLPTAQRAMRVIDRSTKKLQKRAWWFNADYNITLNASVSGEVIIPDNATIVDFNRNDKYVQRGNRVYDPVNHTFIIGSNIVLVRLVQAFDLADLPEQAAEYIKHLSAQTMYEDDDGDGSKIVTLTRRTMDAWADFNREHLKQSRVNSKNNPNVLLLRVGNTQAQSNLRS